ncbi:GNAT family N-acetyltransferase [Corynebacterium durum]|uniref:GNAT family N-acetyltransferase n=1 Tax=Corynebacterium durum TaxID=61592 RepID=UPI0026DD48ED|nr:GNAT family N-acetyltransferase [Corynebacterium durum]MDO4652416.1 GNAT family N-acetyltransferase [Corynebacterium durum]
MSAEDNANIVRLWAAETHVLPPVERGTSTRVVTPPLFVAADQRDAAALSFQWSVPQVGLPTVDEVSLVDPADESGRQVPVSDPMELLALLQRVAAFRAGRDTADDPDLEAVRRAHEALVDTLNTTENASDDAPAASTPAEPADGSMEGHTPGAWLKANSFFFPTLRGRDTLNHSGPTGTTWLATAGFGGPKDDMPELSLDGLDLPGKMAGAAEFEGCELREAHGPADAERIAGWMQSELLYTFRQPWSVERWEEELDLLNSQPFTQPYILSAEGSPIGYIEVYRPAHMSIGASRPTDPRTVGIHIGVADTLRVGKGMGRDLVTLFGVAALLGDKALFSHALGEPNLLNNAARGAAKHTMGGEVAQLAFPHKCAALLSSAPTVLSAVISARAQYE